MADSSSIVLSMEKILICAPSERIAELRKGECGKKWLVMRAFGMLYKGSALRSPPPSGCSMGREGLGTNGFDRNQLGASLPAFPGRSL